MRSLCPLVVLAGTGAGVVASELPDPLHFRNESARINQTVAEDPGNNVKEVGFGDIDNDGDLDVVVGVAGGVFGLRKNKLYMNDGGVFNEVSGSTIIPGFSVLDLTRHVFIHDYDHDNWNDIVIANDDLAGGGPFKIYINQQAGDSFSHFTEEHASRGLNEQASCGAISEDVDLDGDWDIYSGNYPGPSQDTLFLNDGTGHFTIVTANYVPIDSDYTIDVAAGDLNGDGKLDLLVSNHNPNWAYYNDKNGEGDNGVGDYKYGPGGTAGKQNLGNNGADGAMEPGDFNGDGLIDFYYTNKVGTFGDRIMMNTGNDAAGMATFVEVMPPPYPLSNAGNKITVGDLNGDERLDVLVGMVNGRPAILRNTSVNGVISFVDWTPASAFPTGTVHRGHHGAMLDSNGDGDVDVFFGGRNNDFLFEAVAPPTVDETDLGFGDGGGPLPPLYNDHPIATYGRSVAGDTDQYSVSGIPSGAFISVVLNGPDDYVLEIRDAASTLLASSDRGGIGIEEALQHPVAVGGMFFIQVTIADCAEASADLTGDCDVSVDDLVELILAWGSDDPGADVNGDGIVDVDDLIDLVTGWGPIENEYLLEVLSRAG